MTQTPSSTTADAAVGRTITRIDIAAALINDTTPRPDGWHNRERVAFVLTTFEAETIDFEQVFDYGHALLSFDPQVTEAWRQLAILQHAYVETLYIYQLIDEDIYGPINTHLRAVVHHIQWHHHRMSTGDDRELIVIPD